MDDLLPLGATLLVLAALDLLAFGLRAALQRLAAERLAQPGLLSQERDVSFVNNLLAQPGRLRAALNLALVLIRFALAGLAAYTLQVWLAPPVPILFIYLMLAAWVLFSLESGLEHLAMCSPQIWLERLSRWATLWLWVSSPLVAFTYLWKKKSSGGMGIEGLYEEELKTLAEAPPAAVTNQTQERRMIRSIFELGRTLAREVMVPRIDMLALEVSTPLDEAVAAVLRAGFSRVPVYEGTVDNTLGLLYAKDLLRLWQQPEVRGSLRDLLRPAYFVPEGKKLNELLAEMQSQRVHMAIVVDEYGGVAGLVTLEDIVEEIFGEILDEYDQAEEALYQPQPDGSMLFLGRISLDDFNELMGSHLSSEDADTLGGYLFSRLGHVPSVGETVRENGLLLTIEQVIARRIRKVSARWVGGEDSETNGEHPRP